MPMAHGAVLAGRIITDAIRNFFVVLLMLGVGSLIGFGFGEVGVVEIVDAIGLIVFFGFAFSWVAAYFGLATKDEETAQLAGFLFVFPLVFASASFVPVASMASWLQHFANNQPITFAVNAARDLALGLPSNGAIWKMLVWTAGILVVFIPLAVRTYRKRA